MKRYTYLTKMVLFGCLLCTLPVMFIGLISYVIASAEIQKQVNRGQMQLLTQINSNVEQTLQVVNHSFNQLINSTIMNKVMNDPFSVNDFILYRDLRKEISSVQSSNTKVEDIVIVNPSQNWLIKNSGFYPFDQYLHRTQIANQLLLLSNSTWTINPSLWFYSEEKANSASCPYTISLVKKLPNPKLDQSGIAFANIPTCSISDMLNLTLTESETILILDDQDRILYHSNPDMIGKYLVNTGFARSTMHLHDASGQFQTELDDATYNATYYRSPFNGWVYMSVISVDSLTRDSKLIGLYTFTICLIIAVVFIVFAWFGSRRMYSPIRSLLNQIGGKLPSTGGGGPSVNEFQFISEQVQDLFRSQSELQREVYKHLEQARTFLVIKMFQGTMRRRELMERLEQYGYARKVEDWRIMSVLTMQIDTMEHSRYRKDDVELLLFAINNMVEELIPAEERLPPVFIDQTQITLIGASHDSLEEFNRYLFTATESLQATVLQVLKLKISIGISLPFHDIKHANVAYREGLEALKHRMVLGEGVIISYANLNNGKPQIHLDYPTLTENELADATILADAEKAEEWLASFMRSIFKHERTPQEYQIPFMRLLNRLLMIMQEAAIPLRQLNTGGSSLFEELNALQTSAEIEAWFQERLIHPLVNIFRERQNSQYHNVSEKIIDMIHNYYDTDLTIERCAAELHYNANYLSGVFRKETQQTFSEYLTAYRMNLAQKWLTSTDMTVREMAEKLQYLNSQNFIRSFRKHVGITPGQYRDSSRNNLGM